MFQGEHIVYHQYQDWILAIMVISMVSLIYLFYLKPIYFSRMASALVNINIAEKLNNEKNNLTNSIRHILNIVFSINVGVFFFLFIKHYPIELLVKHDALQLIFFIIGVYLIACLRLFTYYIVGQITNQMTPQAEYSNYWMLLNRTLGMVSIPIILCILYLPINDKTILFYAYFVILAILYIAKLMRGVQISKKFKVSLFSIIVYLCALEIMPIAILIKYLMSN